MAPSRLVLIEFNELSPALLDRFMKAGKLPSFQRFHDSSSVYVTDAGERGDALMPWIAWPSIHSGLPFSKHGVLRLGNGRDLRVPGIGKILSDAGHRVGIFGSMNLNYGTELNGYVLPDPWDRIGKTLPASLQPFFDVIAGQIKENSRCEPLTKRDAVKLALFLAGHGISAGTIAGLLRQFAGERRDRGLFWRRASWRDAIGYDVFRHYNRARDVRFATFYSNSTAHYQHHYWREFEPERFSEPALGESHPSLESAIEYGYRAMDALLARFMRDYADSRLVLATALSQEADTKETFRYYRPINFGALLAFAQIENAAVKPVMSEQFHVDAADEPGAIAVEGKLNQLHLLGEPALWVTREGSRVFAGARYLYQDADDDMLVRLSDAKRIRFGDLFYRMAATRSGMHHPDGALWIRNGEHRVQVERASILDIAPTILAHFDIAAPSYMRGRDLAIPMEEFADARFG